MCAKPCEGRYIYDCRAAWCFNGSVLGRGRLFVGDDLSVRKHKAAIVGGLDVKKKTYDPLVDLNQSEFYFCFSFVSKERKITTSTHYSSSLIAIMRSRCEPQNWRHLVCRNPSSFVNGVYFHLTCVPLLDENSTEGIIISHYPCRNRRLIFIVH